MRKEEATNAGVTEFEAVRYAFISRGLYKCATCVAFVRKVAPREWRLTQIHGGRVNRMQMAAKLIAQHS
eukprot:3858351-Pleurochrysis_carterae.AAC.1